MQIVLARVAEQGPGIRGGFGGSCKVRVVASTREAEGQAGRCQVTEVRLLGASYFFTGRASLSQFKMTQ